MRILVACHSLMMSGGLMRFERFGREAAQLGHSLAYLSFSGGAAQFETDFERLNLSEAAAQDWDVTMVPGQGFPRDTINQFTHLQATSFGTRVQHVLNDKTFESGFRKVNEELAPNIVVFNNRHWSPEEMVTFKGQKHLVLEGAVDTRFFAPGVADRRPSKTRFVIGAQAKTEPVTELLRMFRALPEGVELQFFNKVHKLPSEYDDLLKSGRVKFLGKLNERQLRDFYHNCDCVIHNEKFAGWANIVAEAMACGVPVVCTNPGTLALAKHLETAIVIPKADAKTLLKAVKYIAEHPGKANKMATNARAHVCALDWRDYSKKLLGLLQRSA